MTDQQVVTNVLQQFGSLGVLIAVAGYALRFLHTQLTASLEKRVSDAQLFTTKLLELVEAQHKQMDTLASAIGGSSDATQELRRVIEANSAKLEALIAKLEALTSVPRRGV